MSIEGWATNEITDAEMKILSLKRDLSYENGRIYVARRLLQELKNETEAKQDDTVP